MAMKEFTPNIFNRLEPYYNTDTPHFLIQTPEQIRHGYVSRQTALDLCDPWVDLQMDIELLPKIDSKIPKTGNAKK
ncbi:hypothetical protein LSH36_206g02062 [Paralvinella palmiformis]|uniref:Uncharacterized protein n=1 Tax=Paralvinella palmiformis TaxID=53620 RepID=A0AAD9JQG7_9ANNE|nr:hypothetical protein LSH36_206g02062 [Paralvinella palmiformis]